MSLAPDTNRYTDLCRGNARLVETLAAGEEIWLPFIGSPRILDRTSVGGT